MEAVSITGAGEVVRGSVRTYVRLTDVTGAGSVATTGATGVAADVMVGRAVVRASGASYP